MRRRVAMAGLVLWLLAWTSPASSAAAVCADWVATAVSLQGNVQTRRTGEVQWVRLRLNETYCVGDTIRVDARSRAAIRLRNGALLRLDQNTTLTFVAPTTAERSWVGLLSGAVHFVSRIARSLHVLTPFVNAAVEGTEFWIEVGADQAVVTVLEGRVAASNAAGSVTLTSGQSAVARAGQPPTLRPIPVAPRDAIRWALYYPPVLDLRPADFPDRPGQSWPALARQSMASYAAGDLEAAFASLAGVPADVGDPRFFAYRAGLLLAVGRVDEALPDIDRALQLDPGSAAAWALRAVIAVVRDEPGDARQLAERAVETDRGSAAARLALSYAQQALFDLPAALASARAAVSLRPDDALAWARVAELWLAVPDLADALAAARAAVDRDPRLARSQTVLGFVALSRIQIAEAVAAFERAIELDPADPLPRLGLGLARIRAGDLEAGRLELETALSLDPGNALVRSYLGKAYYEAKRDGLAAGQFDIAKTLDPRDPTPWFYDAIRKQSVNRPVEALADLQRAIELNDNRAVSRSRLLLDEDRAARGASLARIYDNLGFEQLALLEGWKSVNTDVANPSAHRFLADAYSVLPRHEVARVSEVLQAQLLQPLTVNPVPPSLALSDSFILAGTGPSTASLNEFNQLFERNRFSLRLSGVAGSHDTYGDEVAASALWQRLAVSLGQFHYETDGFRANNDQRRDLYQLFAQLQLSHATSLQAELRATRFDRGDLPLRFDRDNFSPLLRQQDDVDSIRVGARHAFAPGSDLVLSGLFGTAEFETSVGPGVVLKTDERSYGGELQHLYRQPRWGLTSGAGYFTVDREDVFLGVPTEATVRHANLYLYSLVTPIRQLTVTLGASGDFLEGAITDREQFNPKVGLLWNAPTGTTLRAAAFRTLKRTLITDQTVEPTQVAGFNQFFDDPEGTDAWRYGVGVDQRLGAVLYGGAEFARRELAVPRLTLGPAPRVDEVEEREDLARAYLYWAPSSWIVVRAEYLYERLEKDPEARNRDQLAEVRTHRVPVGVGLFHPSGLTATVTGTWVHQEGRFGGAEGVRPGKDSFWVVDATLAYRLPRRWGILSVAVRNLLDERFNFQDTDPGRPTVAPERFVVARFTVAY